MNELGKARKVVEKHEPRDVSVPGQSAWYNEDPVCLTIIGHALKRGFFYVGDVIKLLNMRRISLGFPGTLTSKSNPVNVAVWREMVNGKMADNQAIWELDIESVLAYLRGYKPRRRKERS